MLRRFLLVVLIAALVTAARRDDALQSLVAAEKAFARDGAALGQRDAWLKWFAVDGIMFRPGPVFVHATMSNPETAALPPGTMQWEPLYGDVARSGDLGYSTGPVAVRDSTDPKLPPRYSYFFSIWRRDAADQWKVVLDLGARVPQTQNAATFFGRPFTAAPSVDSPRTPFALDALLRFDRASVTLEQQMALYHASARALRWDAEPLIGAEAIGVWLRENGRATAHAPAGGSISTAGDLGYTYGAWSGESGAKGHYARVWKRERSGNWKIVFEVERPDPQ